MMMLLAKLSYIGVGMVYLHIRILVSSQSTHLYSFIQQYNNNIVRVAHTHTHTQTTHKLY